MILAIGYFTSVLRWISAEPPFSLPDQLSGMLDIGLRGLLADPPIKGIQGLGCRAGCRW